MTTTTIGSGTIDNSPTINYGDTILNYGNVDNAIVYSQLVTEAGAKDVNTKVGFFGTLTVNLGGTSLDGIISSGGSAIIEGLAENVTLNGGSAITISGGTLLNASEGIGVTDEITLVSGFIKNTSLAGGGELLEHGGSAVNGIFSNQSADIVYTGGNDLHTTFTAAGLGYLEGGSFSFASVIDSTLYLLSGTQYDANIGALGFDTIVGGMASGTTMNARGIQFIEGGTVTGDVIETGGTVTQLSGTLLRITGNGGTLGATTLDGGTLIIKSGKQTGTISFTSLGGTLIDATSNHLKISGFAVAAPGADIIDLSDTSIPKSRQVTLNSKGVLTIGSIKETFVHGAGMILNLTSTTSGVEITEKKAPAETSAASSSSAALSAKASSAFTANMWNNPKMDFLGTSLSDEPLGETHLANTSTAPLLREAFEATDIIGLKGAASSALKFEAPSTIVDGAVATMLFQNSTLAAAIFNAGKNEA